METHGNPWENLTILRATVYQVYPIFAHPQGVPKRPSGSRWGWRTRGRSLTWMVKLPWFPVCFSHGKSDISVIFGRVTNEGVAFCGYSSPFFWAHTPYENHGTWEMKLPLPLWTLLTTQMMHPFRQICGKIRSFANMGMGQTYYIYNIYIYPLVI